MPTCNKFIESKGRQCLLSTMDGFDRCRWHVQCCGYTKDDRRCQSRAQPEFEYLYCRSSHAPASRTRRTQQCTAIAASTGRQCLLDALRQGDHSFHRCRWHVLCRGLNEQDGTPCQARAQPEFGYFYCRQAHMPNNQCTGIASSTGERCKNPCLKGEAFRNCKWHVQCCGRTRSGNRCGSRALAEFGYLYCCADHDPRVERSTDPKLFRVEELLESKSTAVLQYRQEKDAYTDAKVVVTPPRAANGGHVSRIAIMPAFVDKECQLDHVMEIHVVRDAYDGLKKSGTAFATRKLQLLSYLRDDVVNEVENLNFTTEGINLNKFEGVRAFQQDYRARSGRQEKEGLFPYLQDAKAKSFEKLTRSESERIQKEMLESGDKIIDMLQEENNTHGQMIELLHDNIAAMRLPY